MASPRTEPTTRPRLLDLFCGAGGCSVGFARAGFDVVGVDSIHHDDYPDSTLSMFGHGLDVECTFMQADALDVLRDHDYLDTFLVVAASPPCPFYSTITPNETRGAHPDLISPVREALEAWGGVYLIENVEGASRAMPGAIRLCGSSFGLAVRRHRLFLSNVHLTAPPCDHATQGRPIGVYGDHPQDDSGYRRPDGTRRGQKARTTVEARRALGISWMGWDDLTDAIPPVYTQHLGEQLLAELEVAA